MRPLLAALAMLLVGSMFATSLQPAPTVMAAPAAQQVTATSPASPVPTVAGTTTATTTATATPPLTATAGTVTATVTGTAATVTATTTVTTTTTPSPTAPPLTPTIDPGIDVPTVVTILGYKITFLGYTINAGGTTTWTYSLELVGTAPSLDNWVIGLPGCVLNGATPATYTVVNPDPESSLNGVLWTLGPNFTSGQFSVTIANATYVNDTNIALNGAEVYFGEIAGPGCSSSSGGGDDDDDDGGDDDDDNGGGNDDDDGDGDDDDNGGGNGNGNGPPAVIIIGNPGPPVIIVQNGITIINLVLDIDCTGGPANNVFLILDLDLITLIDLQFLQGIGYVTSLDDDQVIIGLGQNNTITGNGQKIKIDLKFKVDIDIDDDALAGPTFNALAQEQQVATLGYALEYRDSGGARRTERTEITVPIPAPEAASPPAAAPLPRLTTEEIDSRFRARWNAGGLRLYGLPLTRPTTLSSGIVVQYFERARFEYHPANAGTEYAVLLGRLAAELGYGQPPVAAPTSAAERAWYFPETGHLIAPAFRSYWQSQGGLATYGYPIGEAFVDSRGFTVQYFERVRMELHPEFAGTENEVLLGLLGEEQLLRNGGRVAAE